MFSTQLNNSQKKNIQNVPILKAKELIENTENDLQNLIKDIEKNIKDIKKNNIEITSYDFYFMTFMYYIVDDLYSLLKIKKKIEKSLLSLENTDTDVVIMEKLTTLNQMVKDYETRFKNDNKLIKFLYRYITNTKTKLNNLEKYLDCVYVMLESKKTTIDEYVMVQSTKELYRCEILDNIYCQLKTTLDEIKKNLEDKSFFNQEDSEIQFIQQIYLYQKINSVEEQISPQLKISLKGKRGENF